MNQLADDKKFEILKVAMETIAYEYFAVAGRHATESHELAEFYAKLDPSSITPRILARNAQMAKLIASSLAAYPNFLRDLHDAIEQGKMPRSKRADRTVT